MKFSSRELTNRDGSYVSSQLGNLLATTAGRRGEAVSVNRNLMSMSEMFLMNKPVIPDQQNVLGSLNAVASGTLGLISKNAESMDGGMMNLVPVDIVNRLSTDIDGTGAPYTRNPLFSHAGDLIESFRNNEIGGIDSSGRAVPVGQHVGILGPPSNRDVNTYRLQTPAINAARILREMGFDGTIHGYSPREGGDHPRGLALDVMVPLTPEGRQIGNTVASFFLQHRDQLQVKYIIWYEKTASGRTGWSWVPYTRYADQPNNDTLQHRDHPHISFLG